MKKATPKAEYVAELKVMGKTFTAKGSTAREAIENLKPGVAKTRGILTVTHGKTKRDRILMPVQTFRIFNSAGLMREVALKNISLLFAGI